MMNNTRKLSETGTQEAEEVKEEKKTKKNNDFEE